MEVGSHSQINGYMTVYDNPRSKSFIDLCPRLLRFNIFKLLFLKKLQAIIEVKFHMESPWDVGIENLLKCSGSHDQVASRSIHGKKTSKNLRIQNQEVDDLETWYTASGTQVLPNMFK